VRCCCCALPWPRRGAARPKERCCSDRKNAEKSASRDAQRARSAAHGAPPAGVRLRRGAGAGVVRGAAAGRG
jgi:hypothetical protein